MTKPADLRVVHIGSGRYRPGDRSHVTHAIWRELASGFGHYHVIGRSTAGPSSWTEGNLEVTLINSRTAREAEFLATQFTTVGAMVRDRPHVIICQSPAAGGLAALKAAGPTGARILMELHSDVYFSPFRTGSKRWLYHLLSRRPLQRADSIRVLSQGMLQRLRKSFGDEAAQKAHILPPRVDLSRFASPPRKRRVGEPLRLIMVGSVVPRKGQIRLINALARIPFPAELHLVGAGSDLAECRNRAKQQPSPNLHIVCHGAVRPSKLPALLHEADVFILYSDSEGTPRAIMEAMAMGLPVVTTNAGFCADMLEDGVEGVVLGADPNAEIIDVLQRFQDDPSLVERMGAAAQKRAHRDYDSVRLFDEYRRLIAETANA